MTLPGYARSKGFTLIEFMILMLVLVSLFRIGLKGNKEYELHSRWARALQETVLPVKSAISQCLKDHAGNRNACNEWVADKLGRYGITQMPAAQPLFPETYQLQHDGTIQITGPECTVNLIPVLPDATHWQIVISAAAESRFSTEDCRCVINSRSLLNNYMVTDKPENCASVLRLLF